MRVAVVTTSAPFERDPVDLLAERLVGELAGNGHQAAVLRLPFAETRAVLEQVLALRLVVLAHVDRVVALGFPAYHVRHETTVVWLVERDRAAAVLPHGAGPEPNRAPVFASLHGANREALGRASALFSPSEAVARSVEADYGLPSEVLPPPTPAGTAGDTSWHHVTERLTA
jgi:hypothetical protein